MQFIRCYHNRILEFRMPVSQAAKSFQRPNYVSTACCLLLLDMFHYRYFPYPSWTHINHRKPSRSITNHIQSPSTRHQTASRLPSQALRSGRHWVQTTRTRVGRVRHWCSALAFQLAKSEIAIGSYDQSYHLSFDHGLSLLVCHILGYPRVIALSLFPMVSRWLKGTTILQRVWILIALARLCWRIAKKIWYAKNDPSEAATVLMTRLVEDRVVESIAHLRAYVENVGTSGNELASFTRFILFLVLLCVESRLVAKNITCRSRPL